MDIKYTKKNNANNKISLKVQDFSLNPQDAGDKKVIEALNVAVVPSTAKDIEGWSKKTPLDRISKWNGMVRMAADGMSVLTGSTAGRVMWIKPKSDFAASKLVTSGFNLLRLTTLGIAEVGGDLTNGCYFIVPKLTMGQWGMSDENNGLLFTNKDGENITPLAVRFQPLSAGVPTSVADGDSIVGYTVTYKGKTYSTYVTSEAGYIIISDRYKANTCAHIAMDGMYDRYVAIDDDSDSGTVINISDIISDVNNDNVLYHIDNDVWDSIEMSNNLLVGVKRCGVANVDSLTWSNEPDGNLYDHYTDFADLAETGFKAGGRAKLSDGTPLNVAGMELSYRDGNTGAKALPVVYEMEESDTPQAASLSSSVISVCHHGIEILTGITGEAEIAIKYQQNYASKLGNVAETDVSDEVARLQEENASLARENELMLGIVSYMMINAETLVYQNRNGRWQFSPDYEASDESGASFPSHYPDAVKVISIGAVEGSRDEYSGYFGNEDIPNTSVETLLLNLPGVENLVSAFGWMSGLKRAVLFGYASGVSDVSYLFWNDEQLVTADLSSLHIAPNRMESMFSACRALETLDMSSVDTSSCYVINFFLSSCFSLRDFKAPIAGTLKPSVSFGDCGNLTLDSINSIIDWLYDFTSGQRIEPYDALVTYTPGDMVRYGKEKFYYICVDSPRGTPTQDTDAWKLCGVLTLSDKSIALYGARRLEDAISAKGWVLAH